jgi:hypothetical protein
MSNSTTTSEQSRGAHGGAASERMSLSRKQPKDLLEAATHERGATPDRIWEEERKYIAAYRRRVGRGDEDASLTFGLALSGGGIRSATIALGVMQAMASSGRMHRFDFLSTVSGGGYIGSSLTWFTSIFTKPTAEGSLKTPALPRGHDRAISDGVEFGARRENFPFGIQPPAAPLVPPLSDAQRILLFLRQHGNFLIPGQGINVFSGIAMVLRGILVNLFIWLPITCLITLLLIRSGWLPYALPVAGGLMIVLLLVGLAYSAWTRWNFGESVARGYSFRRTLDGRSKWLVVPPVVLLVIGLVPPLDHALGSWFKEVSLASILGGMASGFLTFWKSRQSDKGGRGLPAFLPAIGAALLLYGVLILAHHAANSVLTESVRPEWGHSVAALINAGEALLPDYLVRLAREIVRYISNPNLPNGWIVAILLAWCVAALLVAWYANINYTTIHRYYRDRLMESFMPDRPVALNNLTTWSPIADQARLSQMCDPEKPGGPYHLVNTNIMLNDSQTPVWRQRGGDSFILSPRYCGSSATGWLQTDKWMGGAMPLATAMAISGAAANPGTGVGGVGPGRNPVVAVLMAMLNLRLGFWVSNPGYGGFLGGIPNHIDPTLFELAHRTQAERARIVQLSDGGHFDNLGLYELVRRKVSLIVISDGGADPEYGFGDLLSVLPRIRADLGTTIEFEENYKLDGMIPVPAVPGTPRYPNRRDLSQRGFALGTINYPGGQRGVLIFLKASVSHEMDTELLGYKGQISDFPNESTIDQFYSEAKFEAHRGVGFALTANMLREVSRAVAYANLRVPFTSQEDRDAALEAPRYPVLRSEVLQRFFADDLGRMEAHVRIGGSLAQFAY